MTNRDKQEQRNQAGAAFKTAGLVLRLAARMPGVFIRANKAYRDFRQTFVQAALSQGMPEELALELVSPLKPLKVLGDMRKTSKAKATGCYEVLIQCDDG